MQMLDDSDFRLGPAGGRIKVQPADFSYKAQQEAPIKKSAKDKRKVIAKTQKLNRLDILPYLHVEKRGRRAVVVGILTGKANQQACGLG